MGLLTAEVCDHGRVFAVPDAGCRRVLRALGAQVHVAAPAHTSEEKPSEHWPGERNHSAVHTKSARETGVTHHQLYFWLRQSIGIVANHSMAPPEMKFAMEVKPMPPSLFSSFLFVRLLIMRQTPAAETKLERAASLGAQPSA